MQTTPSSPSLATPRRKIWPIVSGVTVAFIVATAVIMAWMFHDLSAKMSGQNSAAADLADYGTVVDFHLTERSGLDIKYANLAGTIWIADFIFTNCAGPCPLMSLRMSYLQDSIQADPLLKKEMIRLVSFSVDPERDTPSVLSAYADRYEADRDRWWFLTGDIKTIRHISTDGFHLSSPEEPILHSTMFSLVDPHGHIRAYYHSDDPDLVSRILRDVASLVNARRAS